MRFHSPFHPQDSSTSSTGLSTFYRPFQADLPGFPPKCGEFIHILHKLSTGRWEVVDGSRFCRIYYSTITDPGLIRSSRRQISQFLRVFFVTSFIHFSVIRVFVLYTQAMSPVDKKIRGRELSHERGRSSFHLFFDQANRRLSVQGQRRGFARHQTVERGRADHHGVVCAQRDRRHIDLQSCLLYTSPSPRDA